MLKHSIQSLFPGRSSAPSSAKSVSSNGTNEPSSARKQLSSVIQPKTNFEYGNDAVRDIVIDIPPNNISSLAAPALLPTAHISSDSHNSKPNKNLKVYVPLYQASLKGDWHKAREFIELHPRSQSVAITKGGETALHIAAGAKQTKFVEQLVRIMNIDDLNIKNKYGNTALCFAAASGIKRIAEVMVEKNNNLPSVRGSKGVTPLYIAATLGKRDMVSFLYKVTKEEDLTKQDLLGILIASVTSDLYDVALYMLDRQPELAIERDTDGETLLHVLARKPSAQSSTSWLGDWQIFMSSCLKEHGCKDIHRMQSLKLLKCIWQQIWLLGDRQIDDLLKTPSRPLFIAAEYGYFDFVFELLHSYPDLIWKVDENCRSIFHIAVMHRQENIFKLIYEFGAHKDLITSYIDENNTNILHLAAKMAPSNRLNIVSGAALQMQRELLWFKEVEKNVQPSYKDMKNADGLNPRVLFTEEHMWLVKAGERWMKSTASSCMLVATLITTVMFAAIFTVPGGNNSIGNPIFLHTNSFVLFAISDAFALFSSVTGILIFLSVLTSRYAEEDFIETLPKRLIVGLVTLFFSIASMLVAFSASFFIVLGHQLAWVVIPVAVAACVPVALFAFLQFPLLTDMIKCSYGSGIFDCCPRDRRLY